MPTPSHLRNRKTPGQAAALNKYQDTLRERRKVPLVDEKKEKRARKKYKYDLEGFLLKYMAPAFPKPFCDDHRKALKRMQSDILEGGLSGFCMPRGSGKTTMAMGAVIWALLYGHLGYIAVVSSDQTAANEFVSDVKTLIWLSPGIKDGWPQLAEYIQKGDGHQQKFNHALNHDGTPPLIRWGKDTLRLPSTPENMKQEWSGGLLRAKGLTGGIRGLNIAKPDGSIDRPDYIIVDDPQTKESARSISQTDQREEIIDGDLMGLAGPGESISGCMLMTVIEANDLADRYLDPKRHGEWGVVRSKMIEEWPDELDGLWQEYKILYLKNLREEPENRKNLHIEFYQNNREAMDKGSRVYWEHRKKETDVSAIQHAMDLFFRLRNAFLSEYQNEPLQRTSGAPYQIDEIQVMESTNGLDRFHAPKDAPFIVTMTDINFSGLNTVVLASTNNAVVHVIDWGTYPEGNEPLYDPGKKKNKIAEEIAIVRALDYHIREITQPRYFRDGKMVSPDLTLIDCGNWMELVFRWCKMNAHLMGSERVYPSRGRSDNKYRPTQCVGPPGDNWHVADWKYGRVLVHNADYWRMKAQQGFITPAPAPGSITLYGKNPSNHKRFADEVCAEVLEDYIELTDQGNRFYKWGRKVGVANDLLDALVGARAGVSCLGARESSIEVESKGQKKQPRGRRRGRKVKKAKI